MFFLSVILCEVTNVCLEMNLKIHERNSLKHRSAAMTPLDCYDSLGLRAKNGFKIVWVDLSDECK